MLPQSFQAEVCTDNEKTEQQPTLKINTEKSDNQYPTTRNQEQPSTATPDN
jgi:hypothetical protein